MNGPPTWRPRQLLLPAAFVACLFLPWSWGGPGCRLTAEVGGFVAIHDGIAAWELVGTPLWSGDDRRVAAALSSRLAVGSWLLVVAWLGCLVVPGRTAAHWRGILGGVAAGAVGALLIVHDLAYSLEGLALGAGGVTLAGAGCALGFYRGDPRLIRVTAGVLGCYALARLIHPEGTHLFGGSCAALLVSGAALRSVRLMARPCEPAAALNAGPPPSQELVQDRSA